MRDPNPMVDTNILVYAHNQDSPYFNQAKRLLEDLVEKGGFCLSSLILLEFFSVITNGRKVDAPLSPETAINVVDDILESQAINVIEVHDDLGFFQWLRTFSDLIKRYQIYDAVIAYTMYRDQISTLYTKNTKDFKKFNFIQAINPFESIDSRQSPITNRSIPYGRQSISEQDVAAVCKVLRSDWLTQGPTVPAFEKAVADYCGATHAVAVNSGTSALHLACLALGVGPGDLVWTSPITFVASANCARYCGADVDFVDIDPRTYNLSPNCLSEKLKQTKNKGRLPKVLIPVHLTGQPCDMKTIHALSEEYGFRIIEDACHAIGGRYKGQPIGNCRYSDITIFSFHPVKTITTAEGGMAVTNDPELAQRMALLRSHGITREAGKAESREQGAGSRERAGPEAFEPLAPRPLPQAPRSMPPAYYYEQIALGFNYRMTDVQAALGLSQLPRLDEFVQKRHALARRYDELLADLPVTIPWQHADGHSGMHLYVIRLKLDEIKKTRDQVFEELRTSGIGVNLHYIPVYRQPDFARLGPKPLSSAPFSDPHAPCFEAESYYAEAITLPLFPTMTNDDVTHVVETLRSAIS